MNKEFQVFRNPAPLAATSAETSPELIRAGFDRNRRHVPPRERSSEVASLLRVLYKHWRISAVTAALIFASVAVATLLIKPLYEPTARVEVDPPGSETFSLDRHDTPDPEWVDTQVESLEGEGLAIATIRQLHLDSNKDFVGSAQPGKSQEKGNVEQGAQLAPSESMALRTFKDRLRVSRKLKGHVIEVSVGAHDPKLAALVTNTLISTYTDKYYNARYEAVMRSSEWLSRQLDDIRIKLLESNKALTDYQKSTGIADIDDKQSTVTQSLLELNRQLALAQGDRIQLESYLSRVAAGNVKTLPLIRDNPVRQDLTKDLDEAEAELSQTRVVYGDEHPKVRSLRTKVEQLRRQIEMHDNATVDQLRASYGAARSREELLLGKLRGITGDMTRMAHYNSLKREAQTTSDLYNSLYARVKESGIAAASRSSNIRLVDSARVLDKPTRPRKALNLGIGFALAVLGGLVAAIGKEVVDPRLHSPQDIKKWTGLPALSIMPRFGARKLGRKDTREFILERPNSPEAEAVRGLFTALMLPQSCKVPRALLIASPSPGDGKTTIAINLALALSRHGSTCLIDADLRKRSMSAHFGLESSNGLTELVSGNANIKDVLVSVNDTLYLSIVPAGTAPENAGEIIISEKMRDLIRDLRERFQFVVMDSPPILLYADARALAASSDGVVLVGRYALTSREALNCAAEQLEESRAPILGVVLNGADFSAPDYRHYGYSEERLRQA